MKNMTKKWKRIVDNKMRWHGDIDDEKKIIRVNKSKEDNRKPGEILDTIIHEETHRKHPKMKEETVKSVTKKLMASLSPREKGKLYGKYKG